VVDLAVMRKVIKGLNEGSSLGVSIIGYATIKDLLRFGYEDTLKATFESILNADLQGETRVLLRSAKLVALLKPNGKVRPIAMGDSLRKVAMSLLCAMHKEEFNTFFTAPITAGLPQGSPMLAAGSRPAGARGVAVQLGVGTRGGTEIAAKTIGAHLELNPTWAAFKNDFSNAFNCCSRRRMVEQLMQSPFAHFEPALRFFYEQAGDLYFEGEQLLEGSCEGAQQGDPLGPFIFALAFHATLQQVAAEFPDCVLISYLDDVTVLGEPARAYAALQRLQELALKQCDLASDMTKCGVFSPAAPDEAMDMIAAEVEGSPHYPGDKDGNNKGRLRGMIFVGAPIGHDDWVEEEVADLFRKMVQRLPVLARMRDKGRLQTAQQCRLLLLRYCANPRAAFWLRVVKPEIIERAGLVHDKAFEECLRAMCQAEGAEDDPR
jgi:hypothetical protein